MVNDKYSVFFSLSRMRELVQTQGLAAVLKGTRWQYSVMPEELRRGRKLSSRVGSIYSSIPRMKI